MKKKTGYILLLLFALVRPEWVGGGSRIRAWILLLYILYYIIVASVRNDNNGPVDGRTKGVVYKCVCVCASV